MTADVRTKKYPLISTEKKRAIRAYAVLLAREIVSISGLPPYGWHTVAAQRRILTGLLVKLLTFSTIARL